ncbi:MAPK regulated corepressor interacting protein 2 isoform 2-T2 [Cochliomyia hominivorax]
MYTVSKGPSKIVAKTRRGLSQNFETFETIKESSKRNNDANSPEKLSVPRPVFQTKKIYTHPKIVEEEVLTPQHEEIIKYINDSWNIIVAHNPYDRAPTKTSVADANNNTAAPSSIYCVEPPSPVFSDFKPFDLESWWGRRLFNNITKSL